MVTQGILPFRYAPEPYTSGMTALAGLPLYLELAEGLEMIDSIRHHMQVCAHQRQGWRDEQIVMALVLLNLAGGEAVDDLRILEGDEGFAQLLRRVELHGLPRGERRELARRWRKARRRAVPSPPVAFRYLARFRNEEEEEKRGMGQAFIPAPNEHLQALGQVNGDLLGAAQRRWPQPVATIDQDATLVETHKQDALYCYQHYRAYQPLTSYWAEQGLVVCSQFRDGNVPAGYENLEELRKALELLPAGVHEVRYRADTAAYQWEVLRYCAEGKNERFGVIPFGVSVDVTPEFKAAVAEVEAAEWRPLHRQEGEQWVETGQEWAEVCFVPKGQGLSKNGPTYRYLAIREPLAQRVLPGMEGEVQLPFPTMAMGTQRYKVSGIVTNRTEVVGEELIHWQRARCGKGEEVHSVMKSDLAGGQLPSGHFGDNAAWWAVTVLAHNLHVLMQRHLLPAGWEAKRLKAIRFGLITVAGRVVTHARELILRVSRTHPAYPLFVGVRERIHALQGGGGARAPALSPS